LIGEKTDTIALFTHTSIGPSSRSIRPGGRFHLIRVGDVGGRDQGASPERFDFAARRFEAVDAARDQADIGALARERAHGGAA
jgi:hypothetical protein